MLLALWPGAVSSLIAVISLTYVIRQYASLEKQLATSLVSDTKTHIQNLNQLLLSTPRFYEHFEFDEKQLLAFIMLQEAERAYLLRESSDVFQSQWERMSTYTLPQLLRLPIIRDQWPKIKNQWDKGFAVYVDSQLTSV